MAHVTSPTGSGNLANTIIVDKNGNVRRWLKPNDPRTAAQLKYRQTMRALNHVLKFFADATDQDLRTSLNDPTWWSAHTFGQFAQGHDADLIADVNRYGFTATFQEPTTVDDFNRADAPSLGADWQPYGPSLHIQANHATADGLSYPGNYYTPINASDVAAKITIHRGTSVYKWPTSARLQTRLTTDNSQAYLAFASHIQNPAYVQFSLSKKEHEQSTTLAFGPWLDLEFEDSYSLGIETIADRLRLAYKLSSQSAWTDAIMLHNPNPLSTGYTSIQYSSPATSNGPYMDDFGAAGPATDVTAQWNAAAHAIGIDDLSEPVAPFNYGEAGELLFCVCSRLWRMTADPGLPDPFGTDPENWKTYIETGTYPQE